MDEVIGIADDDVALRQKLLQVAIHDHWPFASRKALRAGRQHEIDPAPIGCRKQSGANQRGACLISANHRGNGRPAR